jgi:WhiB family transcriptional regulator, redox-sensing transcriptional regulator
MFIALRQPDVMPINITTSTTDLTGRFSGHHHDQDPLAWQESALCAQTGPDFFFPAPGSSTREAKKLCGACPEQAACLAYALENDERFGVWGGLSERERLRLRRGKR